MYSRGPPHKFPELRKTAKRHIHWQVIKTYTTTYKAGRTRITIRSVTKPKPTRLFRTARGLRTFKATHTKVSRKEVLIVMATKGKSRSKGKQVDEELQELEELEELDELDEEEDEEEEDEDEEDEDDEPDDEDEDEDDEEEEEAPKRSRAKSKSAKAKSKKPAQSRAAANGKVGTQEVAEHFGIDGRTLRILLRRHDIPKDEDSGRYEWSSLKNKEVIRIGKLVKSGAAKAAKKEGLDKLKASKAAKSSTKKTVAKKGTTKKRRKPVEDDEDDE